MSGPRRGWADLPLHAYAACAVAIAHAQLQNLEPPRLEHLPTALFPLLVVWAVYALRWRTADAGQRLVALAVALGAPALIVLDAALALAGIGRTPLPPATLRDIYEVSAVAQTALLMVHAAGSGRAALAFFLGPAALYGILLENGGILLGYFSELHYRAYLGPLPAPLATVSGWLTVFYQVTWIAWEIGRQVPAIARRPWASAAVATAAAVALDLQIDPLATAVGFWVWDPRLPAAFFGVPLLNFVAWAAAVFPFSLCVFWRERACALGPGEVMQTPHRTWVLHRVPAVLVAAAALFLGGMTLAEQGIGGPTYAILGEAAQRVGAVRIAQSWRPGGSLNPSAER